MELVYVWIEKYRNIALQGFNLSSKYRFELANLQTTKRGKVSSAELVVHRNADYIPQFFGEQIVNLTVLSGGHGSGKTNFMDFLRYLEDATKEGLPENKVILVFESMGKSRQNRNFAKGLHLYHNFNLSFQKQDFAVAEHLRNTLHAQRGKEPLFFHLGLMLQHYKLHPEGRLQLRQALLSKNLNSPQPPSLSADTLVTDAIDAAAYEQEQTEQMLYFVSHMQQHEFPFRLPQHVSINVAVQHIDNQIMAISRLFYERATEAVGMLQTVSFVDQLKVSSIVGFLNYVFYDNLAIDLSRNDLYLKALSLIKRNDVGQSFNDFFGFVVSNNDPKHPLVLKIKALQQMVELFESNRLVTKTKHDTLVLHLDTDHVLIEQILHLHQSAHIASVQPEGRQRTLIFNFAQMDGRTAETYYLSSGERAWLSFFSRLYYLFHIDTTIGQYYPLKDVVLMIDNADASLHPTLQQRWISDLVTWLPRLLSFRSARDRQVNARVQVLVSTLSAMVVADVPCNNIVFLQRATDGACRVTDSSSMPATMGANIQNILNHVLGVEGFMSQFASGKLDEIIRFLHNERSVIQSFEQARAHVELLGEPIARRELQKLITEKYLAQLSKLEDVQNELNRLQQRLKQLEKPLQ